MSVDNTQGVRSKLKTWLLMFKVLLIYSALYKKGHDTVKNKGPSWKCKCVVSWLQVCSVSMSVHGNCTAVLVSLYDIVLTVGMRQLPMMQYSLLHLLIFSGLKKYLDT